MKTRFLAVVVVVASVYDAAAAQRGEPVTFSEHIAPIVFRHCASCHRPDGPAPFSLATYDEVRQRATLIADATKRRYMPPWKPDAPPGTFVGERRLTENEIDQIDRWARSGARQGDVAHQPPTPKWTSRWQLGEPDVVLNFPEYTLRADGLDVFRNFVLPIPAGGLRYVRGLEFRPQSAAVHHANIRVDYTRASRRMDEEDAGPGYEGLISRTADYPDGHFLGWTPGQFPPIAPTGLAWRLGDNGDFVVQLHMRPTGRPERIQPAIGLFFTDEAPVSLPVMLRLGRQNIDIQPGDASYRSTDEYVLPVDAEIHALQPHSHYRAQTVKAWATLPDGSIRALVTIPQWDFAWQDVYRLASPFWLPAGTRLHTEYVFDNSAASRRNPESPPKRARWGFRSSDEMGDVWIQVMTRNAADRTRLARDFRRKDADEETVGYEMQLAVDPDNVALHDDVALLYLELEKPHLAAAHFEASRRLRPKSAAAAYNLGTAREAAGRVSEATALFVEAIQLDPNYAPAHVNLGNMLLLQGRVADALAHYRDAVRAQPDSADARNNLGRLLFAQGQRQEGLELLQEAVRLQPAHVAAHFNLGGALIQQTGDAADAAAHFREASRLRPDWTPPLLALSWVLSSHPDAAIRRPDEAVQLAARAADLSNRSDAAALDALAAAYASAGRFEEAVVSATRAAELASRAAAKEQLTQIRRRLSLYEQRKPYIEELR